MGYNDFVVSSNKANTGSFKAADNNETVNRTLIICPPGASIDTQANALLQATWKTNFKKPVASRWYKFPLAIEAKDKSQADIIQERPLAGAKFIRAGKPGLEFTLDVNAGLLKKLRTFNNRACSIMLGDENGNIKGYTDSAGIKFFAFDIQELYVASQPFSDGSKSQEVSVVCQLKSAKQWNDQRAVLQPSWDLNMMDGVNDVNLTITGATTSGYTLTVKRDGIDSTDPASGVVGLIKSDLVCLKTGVSHSITGSVVDNNDGTYTVTDTNTSGSFTLDLVACGSIGLVDEAIESSGAAAFSIS